jgi:chlorobactene glucosyltransferase
MIFQLIVAILLLFFAVNLYLNLRSFKKPLVKNPLTETPPLESVLIPARNEELNIKNCVESLTKQDYPNYEILILDDNSADNTSEIVRQMALKDHRIQLFRGEPLPGKPGVNGYFS